MRYTKETTVKDVLKEASKSVKNMHDISDKVLSGFLVTNKEHIHIKAMRILLIDLLTRLKRKDALKLINDLGFYRQAGIAKRAGMSKSLFHYHGHKYLKKNIKYGKSVFYEWREDGK